MATLELVLRDLENIVERGKKFEVIDDYVEWAVTRYKREHLLRSLQDAIKLVIDSVQRHMRTGAIPESEMIVHSMYHMWMRGNRWREGYLTTPIQHNPLRINELEHNTIMRTYDSYSVRICYFDEFKERSQILLKAVEKGQLDYLFGEPPFYILHQINGRYGELLPGLNIDPLKSRIHRLGKYKIINGVTGKVE